MTVADVFKMMPNIRVGVHEAVEAFTDLKFRDNGDGTAIVISDFDTFTRAVAALKCLREVDDFLRLW